MGRLLDFCAWDMVQYLRFCGKVAHVYYKKRNVKMKKLLIISAVAIVMLVPVVSMAGTVAHWTFGANGLTDITGITGKNAIIGSSAKNADKTV